MKLRFLLAVVSPIFILGCDNEPTTASSRPVKIDDRLVSELAAMVAEDQESLQRAVQSQGEEKRKAAFAQKDEVLKKNTDRVEEIFDLFGFPGFDRVGRGGSHDFWLIVQHSDSKPEFQRRVLSEMQRQVDRTNADESDFAFLWDRVKKNSGEPQRFGSQVTYTEEGQAVPFPLEDSKNVNERRKQIGWEPIEKYLNDMSDMHFEINKAHFAEKGVTEPTLYSKGHSTRFLFENPEEATTKH